MKATLLKMRDLFDDIPLEVFLAVGEDHDQSVTGTVVGYKLDNAFGDHVRVEAMLKGWQEYVVTLETFNKHRDGEKFLTESFNLATMIALIRQNYEGLIRRFRNGGKHVAILNGIMAVTRNAREDMHEPDEQEIDLDVTSGREISYRYTDDNRDVEMTLYQEFDGGPRLIKGPNAARLQVTFTVADLVLLIMSIED